VLLVIPELDMGGAEVQLVRLATHLHLEGIAPEVAVFHAGGHLEPALLEAGIPVHHVRRTSKVGMETIFHLRRILKEGRYEIVHTWLWSANWRGRIAGILASTPIIISGPQSVDSWMRVHHIALDWILARWTEDVVVNAEAVREFFGQRVKIPDRLIRVIPNGLDAGRYRDVPDRGAARSRIGLPEDAPVVLIVGRLRPEKSQEDFLRMAALVRNERPDARYVIVGDGVRRSALEAEAARLGLRDVVHWAGHQDDVAPFLAACDVFLNTSRVEGLCNAIMEAMAAARPVVAYSVGGNTELIEEGVSGRCIEPGNVEALARAVVEYLDDPEMAERHGARGAGRMVGRYSTESMVESTAGLYKELLAQRNGRQ